MAWNRNVNTKMACKGVVANLIKTGVAISSSAILFACGDDVTNESITQIVQENMAVVADVSKLPDCFSENEGQQALVKGEPSPRICVDGKWFATFSDYTDKLDDFKCSAEKLKDGSGLKILCNGDSIGVVLNGSSGVNGAQGIQGENGDKGDTGAQGIQGEKGDKGDTGAQGIQGEKGDKGDTGAQGIQGEKGDKGDTGAQGIQGEKGDKGDAGEGCTIDRVDNLITIICGDKIATIRVGDIVGNDDDIIHFEDIVLDSQKIAVSLDSLSGFVQKGPFLKGSAVTLYELENGRTLKQGSGIFETNTTNDSGYYKFTALDLVSQYALLQVKGKYKNEVTGVSSTAELTLKALVNVLERKTANVNLLTHLEYGRAYYLVTRADKKPDFAKKLTWSEILAMFYINSDGKKYFEDINLFEADENAAILLAISVLLHGDGSTSELAARLASISSDIEEDGTWDDEPTKAQIADWAESFNDFATLRLNVKSYGISAVPDFEKYMTNFWTHAYGLGTCAAVRYKEVAAVTNASSLNYGTHYYCDTDGWRKATDFEKDTYGWSAGTNGQVKQGNVNRDKYYIYGNGVWQVYLSEVETNIGVCTASREGEVRKSGDAYYICRSKIWNVATPYEYNTYGWRAGTEGEVREGEGKTGEYYIFTDGNWVEYPIGHDLGICVASREGEVGKSGDLYYICKSSNWVEATVLEYDTYGITCNDDGSIINGRVVSANRYVCDNGIFRVAKEQELLIGESCAGFTQWKTIRKAYTATEDSLYYCSDSEWFGSVGMHYDVFTDIRDYKTYKIVIIGTQTWMAENLNYEYNVKTAKSYCHGDSVAYCNKYGRLYTWSAAMDSVGSFSTNGKGCGGGKTCSPTYPVRGICPEGWHLPTNTEWNTLFTAVGGISIAGKMLKSTSGWGANGSDDYDFSALPAGKGGEGGFGSVGSIADFHTSSEYDSKSALYKAFTSSDAGVNGAGMKSIAISVRCLKDTL